MGLDEAELTAALEAMLGGDEEAFRVIFLDVQPRLLRYLTVLVGIDDAEDVAAESWSQVARDLGKFKGSVDGFRGWVATIGRNRALDHLRSRSRRPMADVPLEQLLEPASHDTAFAGAAESDGTARAIALIATLPREQAEAVMLRVVLGLDAKAAGAVLGRRPGAVRTAAHRGLKTLGEKLGEGSSNTFEATDAEGMT